MTEDTLRLAVPPRHLASTITAQAVLRAGWAVAGVFLFTSLAILATLWAGRGYGSLGLLPLASLMAVGSVLLFLARKPDWRRGMVFLTVGTVATFTWVIGLLLLDPTLNEHGIFLLNRMTVVLLLVGAVSARLVHGILWCTAGWLLGTVASAAAQLSLGMEIALGYGPTMSLLVYLVIIVMFVLIKRSQLRFSSAFSVKNIEPARIAGQRELEERAVSLLHDTVLNDLFTLTHGKDQLDERTIARIRSDIRAVREAEVEPEAQHRNTADWLRREILTIVSDFQWRGIRVDITGEAPLQQSMQPRVAEALAGAIRSCLENVVKHSASTAAELFIDASDTEVSVMIVDQGVGFDIGAIPLDRLGIRQSIVQRTDAVGGNVKIWSAVGAGTSVLITVPLGGC